MHVVVSYAVVATAEYFVRMAPGIQTYGKDMISGFTIQSFFGPMPIVTLSTTKFSVRRFMKAYTE